MSKLISSTTLTLDGVTDVGEWYVAEGNHDADARAQFDDDSGVTQLCYAPVGGKPSDDRRDAT